MSEPEDDQVGRRPYTILIPDAPGEGTRIIDRERAISMLCVDRASSARLAVEGTKAGIYVLTWPIDEAGEFECYVGKGNPIESRISQHRLNKEGWTRALIVTSSQPLGFDSAEIGWLEGQLHSRIDNSHLGSVRNKQQPGDETVPQFSKALLSAVVDSVVRVMRLLGYELAEESTIAQGTQRRRKSATGGGVTIADLINAGLLEDGEQLFSTNGQWPAKAKVAAPDGIRYDGVVHTSPSAAGEAARGGGATNGWTFWAVRRGGESVTLAVLRGEYEVSNSNSRSS